MACIAMHTSRTCLLRRAHTLSLRHAASRLRRGHAPARVSGRVAGTSPCMARAPSADCCCCACCPACVLLRRARLPPRVQVLIAGAADGGNAAPAARVLATWHPQDAGIGGGSRSVQGMQSHVFRAGTAPARWPARGSSAAANTRLRVSALAWWGAFAGQLVLGEPALLGLRREGHVRTRVCSGGLYPLEGGTGGSLRMTVAQTREGRGGSMKVVVKRRRKGGGGGRRGAKTSRS